MEEKQIVKFSLSFIGEQPPQMVHQPRALNAQTAVQSDEESVKGVILQKSNQSTTKRQRGEPKSAIQLKKLKCQTCLKVKSKANAKSNHEFKPHQRIL